MSERKSQQHATVEVLDSIHAVSELIFDVLYREGDMDVVHLKQRVHHDDGPMFDWALGWLVGKGDVEIVQVDGSYAVRRNPPTPAVIPIRGN